MRTVSHDLDVNLLRKSFDRSRENLHPAPDKKKTAIAKQNGDFFHYYVVQAFILAQTGYIFDLPPAEIKDALKSALLHLQDQLDIEGAINPIDLRQQIGAALVCGDARLMRWVAQLPQRSYTHPAITISKAGYLLVQALQSGALGDRKQFDTLQKEFMAALDTKKLKVNPKSEKDIYAPLAALLNAVSAGDQSAFEEAWSAQAAAWKKRYGRPSERANPDGLLDVETLGIGKIAQKFGLKVPETNPYAPVKLLIDGKSA